MAQDNLPASDAQEAYEAYQAYKTFRAQKQTSPEEPFTPTPREIPEFSPIKEGFKAVSGALHDHNLFRAFNSPELNTKLDAAHDANPPIQGNPPLAIPAAAAPQKLLQFAEFLGATGPRRIIAGAAQGAASNPEHPIGGAAIGGGLALAGEGANKSADWLMQKSIGKRGYEAGLGNKLVDEGLVGTRDMMEGQTAKNMGRAAGKMQSAVEGIPGPISSSPASKNIMELAEQRSLPVSGNPEPSNASAHVDRILERAAEAEARGEVHPQNAWQYGKISGKLGYGRTGEPLNSLEAQINQAEQAGYSKALQETSPEFAEGAKSYAANATANSALQKDPMGRSLVDALAGTASVLPSVSAQALQKGSYPLRDALLRQLILNNTKK